MTEGVGKALWHIYEEAVADLPEQRDAGLASATRKFIEAFETELDNAKLDLYASSALQNERQFRADIRLVKPRRPSG